MKNNAVKILVIAFLCFVLIWMIASKDISFSEKENRNMASKPEYSWTAVSDGTYMDDFETYLADQFPLRDTCVSVKTAVSRLVGKRLINGVYIGEGGYLIQEEADVDYTHLRELVEAVNAFASDIEDVDVNFMLVPNAVSVYEDKLPYGMTSGQKDTLELVELMLSDDVDYINVYDALKKQTGINLYYKTDHHWTTRGAFVAFETYADANALGMSDVVYRFYNVTNSFQGTQASNSGVYSTMESIEICVPYGQEGNYLVNNMETGNKTATLFDASKLTQKDKYLVFMGGNYSQVNISTLADTGRNLMVIKDSYANCMIPMMTPYYDKIVVIDPRYFYDNIYEVMEINGINEVMFLYNVNSFVEDNSLIDILKK